MQIEASGLGESEEQFRYIKEFPIKGKRKPCAVFRNDPFLFWKLTMTVREECKEIISSSWVKIDFGREEQPLGSCWTRITGTNIRRKQWTGYCSIHKFFLETENTHYNHSREIFERPCLRHFTPQNAARSSGSVFLPFPFPGILQICTVSNWKNWPSYI